MTRIIIVILGVVALVSVACSPAADEQMADTAMEVREIVVEANDFSFGPELIEVKVGEPVRLVLNNIGALEHDWSIAHIAATNVHEMSDHSDAHGGHMHGMGDEPDLHVSAMPGHSGTVEFTPAQAGTYEIVCTIAGHQEAGMVGSLLVTE